MTLQKMPQKEYFEFDPNTAFGKAVLLRDKGMKLIAQYYREKYDINVIMDNNIYNQGQDFMELVKKGRAEQGDYRCAYILIGMRHATPVFYLKSGNSEGFFIPDSMGRTNDHNYGQVRRIISELILEHFPAMPNPAIPIFVTEEIRQADLISCYTDALVFVRDVTAKKENAYFKSAHLVGQLESRATEQVADVSTDFSEKKITLKKALLPDELLKTAQISAFVEDNKSKEKNPSIIHVRKDGTQENLAQFRERYTKTKDGKPYNGYLRNKGLKYSQIIIQQYYKNQLIEELNKLPDIDKDRVAKLTDEFVNQLKSLGENSTNDIAFSLFEAFVFNIKEAATKEFNSNNKKDTLPAEEPENFSSSEDAAFTSKNQIPETAEDDDNKITCVDLENNILTLSEAMKKSISSLSKNILVIGKESKKDMLELLHNQFNYYCEQNKMDLAYNSVIEFIKEASTARGGSFNFFKARHGETHSAKAFFEVLHSAKLDDFVKELQENANQDRVVKETSTKVTSLK
ncbi:hypothetical protein [Legionella bononiensis]|uniref:Dot/Icm T4SS effector n=1 Tax=Legionella bononiensis TaxID=2793102 RepID=A0ABS1WED8_9GAMM|nr:hypothetical protein [Legionella bononiensis]MBL7479419.1 hypothetical protein [Legionella bononiensis]MBL7527708.1 hypothetical protein [Legionella bononiensis]MBL7563609.1 hypothetical protein [Legionella bononiensis]